MSGTNRPIFVCLTSYQYMIADLMAKEYYDEHKIKSVIILKYINGVYLQSQEYAKYMCISRSKKGKLIVLGMSILPMVGLKNSDLYFFNDRDPISKNISKWCDKKNLVEEGIGTYFGEQERKPIGEIIVPDIAYVGYPELYRLKHSYWCKVKKIDYNKLFNETNMIKYLNASDLSLLECDVLFLGQATKKEDDLRKYENQLLKVLKENLPNVKILIKPHPRDVFFEDYDVDQRIALVNSSLIPMPIESFIFNIDVKCVISLYSSAAITLSNMFNNLPFILAYTAFELNLGEQMVNINLFKQFFHNLHIPKNLNEFTDVLENKLQNSCQ